MLEVSEGLRMSCEHLVCANCAGPVVEGRCQTCRAARAEMHHPSGIGKSQLLFALLLVLASVAMLLTVQVAQ